MEVRASGIVLLIGLLFLSVAIIGSISIATGQKYQAEIGREWLWRARATTDLADMAKYLNKSLDQLAPFNGNPCWWFAKPDTDFDLIKGNIIEVRDNAIEWSNLTGGSLAYQQAVQNLQEVIIEIVEHLDGAIEWVGKPVWITAVWILVPIFIVIGVAIFSSWD